MFRTRIFNVKRAQTNGVPFDWASDYEVAVVYITTMWSEFEGPEEDEISIQGTIAKNGFLSYCVRFKAKLAAWSRSVSMLRYTNIRHAENPSLSRILMLHTRRMKLSLSSLLRRNSSALSLKSPNPTPAVIPRTTPPLKFDCAVIDIWGRKPSLFTLNRIKFFATSRETRK